MKRNAQSNDQGDEAKQARLETDYERLDALLTSLRQEFERDGFDFAFSLDEIETPADVDRVRSVYERAGVVGVLNVTNANSEQFARHSIAQSARDLTEDRVPRVVRDQWIDDPKTFDGPYRRARCPEHPKKRDTLNGCMWCNFGPAFGNCAFGYLFPQKTELSDALKFETQDVQVPLDFQPQYARNLAFLEQHPPLMRLILALGYERNETFHDNRPAPMISWDSAKYVYDPRPKNGTASQLTKHHFDQYNNQMSRRQVVVEMSESDEQNRTRRLGYVPFTNHPEVQALVTKILRKPNLYDKDGFIAVDQDPELVDVLNCHSISFNGHHMATWQSTVVHFEAFFKPSTKNEKLCTFSDRKLSAKNKLECIRLVVGTHRPTLTHAQKQQFGILAMNGFVPSAYHRSAYRDTNVYANMMCARTTQNHHYRRVLPYEHDKFEHAQKIVTAPYPHFTKTLHSYSQELCSMLGLEHLKRGFAMRSRGFDGPARVGF